jgi:general secretion pathway protein G
MKTRGVNGFTLIELVITVAVLSILTLGIVPLVQVSVKRQKELQLREALRQMREAIDQFHREALAAPAQNQNPQQPQQINPEGQGRPTQGQPGSLDPRVRVFISDQTIFTVDNPDRYPPTLDILRSGVSVLPINTGGLGKRGNLNFTATEAASEESAVPKTKIYLRQLPIDPMTGKNEWDLRSCYDAVESTSWGGENVFNVHSKSRDTALDGTKYSDW